MKVALGDGIVRRFEARLKLSPTQLLPDRRHDHALQNYQYQRRNSNRSHFATLDSCSLDEAAREP